MTDALRQSAATLPDSPGIYRFYDKSDTLIYVGKAKSLRKRVGSYFTRQNPYNRKTEKLVSEIRRIDFTLANSEFDALLLENNFIKQYQPRYNILLKDDKTFPYLSILKEPFPRIISTRKYLPEQGEYFGPYTSVVSMNSVLDLVRKLYTIRTCTFLLSPENIAKKKFKVCLEFHLGNCRGPCEGLQDESSYLADIAMARNILKGDLSIVERHYHEQMKEASERMAFETADQYKYKLDLLQKFQAKSVVVNARLTDIDVITINTTEEEAFLNYLQIKEGAIIFSKNVELRKKLDESDGEIIASVAHQLRQETNRANPIILSNVPLAVVDEGVENTVPSIGDKKKLVDLSLKNLLFNKSRRMMERQDTSIRNLEVLTQMQKDLQLKSLPRIIECFDNSNFQGTDPVASMVRFADGRPDKAGYRHFHIKTVTGPDDFASMKEIVHRRYTRVIEEGLPHPDLIIVDGGKGQLHSAVESLKELGLYGQIPIIGIAKRLEEIYFPQDTLPLHISKKSPTLRLIQQIRDEAHRFAITFHRKKRSKNTMVTGLEEIDGIGKKTTDELLRKFKSVTKISKATLEELTEVIGASKARLVAEWLKKKER